MMVVAKEIIECVRGRGQRLCWIVLLLSAAPLPCVCILGNYKYLESERK